MNKLLQVQDLGEQALLARVQRFCPIDLVGDDAALLSVGVGQQLVVTTDVLVDGVHFSDGTTTAFDVGWRSVAANLSDLAAMGATPLGITVGLSLPGTQTVAWVEQLYEGMTAGLGQFPIVGGDICRSPTVAVAITALGEVDPNRAIRRSTAQPGDAVLVTGVHGAARAGLELLLHPDRGTGLSEADRSHLIRAHQRPLPRLDVVPLLQEVFGSQPFRLAGMDSSDGLADAVLQICRSSGVGARLDRCQISQPAAFAHWLSAEEALDWTLYGGEDFELVLCLPIVLAQSLQQRLGKGAAIVGTITAGHEVVLGDRDGDRVLTLQRGFQHF